MLATHRSAKTEVLAVLFPQWQDLVGAILWEVVDQIPDGAVILKVKKWIFNFDVTKEEFAECVRIVFGPRPSV